MNIDLLGRYRTIRAFTMQLAEPLAPEDCVIQSGPEVSPTRWHLAHTTWFFETFLLSLSPAYKRFHPHFEYLFNSYYNAVGEQYPRERRGLLSRPTVSEVMDYRLWVDERVEALISGESEYANVIPIIELGLQHEQQHQELILTDIKHVLSCNPLNPIYQQNASGMSGRKTQGAGRRRIPEGTYWIGWSGEGFSFDNESPRHRVFLDSFDLQERPVTNGEYLQFIESGGYRRSDLWLSMGWQQVNNCRWTAPLYWTERDGEWSQFTLSGVRPVDPAEPVCHVSYFEADAFARWAGARLPTEAEWEVAVQDLPIEGNFVEGGVLHPAAASTPDPGQLVQMFGDVWEWTSSSYSPYPGFRPAEGALGEYNGKFMCNQYVLRGGSCATPQSHIRPTYRNFFPPEARWQFSGIRLCR